MPEQFLHGVEVVEVDTGTRPIRTVKSSVIGIVGTAPDSSAAAAASLTVGSVAFESAFTLTADAVGIAGNTIQFTLSNPGTASAALTVAVTDRHISVSMATDANGTATSTATAIIAAINADGDASALVTAALATGSDGSGVPGTRNGAFLQGGFDEPFPLNTPVLIAGSRVEAAKLGTDGTLPAALDGIFDQAGAAVIVVRVTEEVTEAATVTNVVGGVDAGTGQLEGLHALLGAESVTGFTPRIVCAPGFTDDVSSGANPVVAEMVGILERLRAVGIVDGPNTTDAAATSARNMYGSDRLYFCDPWFKVLSTTTGAVVNEEPSARVAGVIAKIDNELGFWNSPSNKQVNGVLGTTRAVDFKLGDVNSRANLLNENEVTTFINQNGFILWGNRTTSADPKWAFLSVRRTADIINDSIQRAHMWAVDKGITKTYVEDVVAGVNGYLESLKNQGAILGGRCWPDPDLNTPANITQGKVFFNFDFTPPYPAEHVTFQSALVNGYIEEVFA